jgi:hypothetical protein
MYGLIGSNGFRAVACQESGRWSVRDCSAALGFCTQSCHILYNIFHLRPSTYCFPTAPKKKNTVWSTSGAILVHVLTEQKAADSNW